VFEIPFLDRMFIVFFFVVGGMVLMSKMAEARRAGNTKALHIDTSLFRVDGAFAMGSAVIGVALATIYGAWW
jgi:solute:Na+ symporter, SSS family